MKKLIWFMALIAMISNYAYGSCKNELELVFCNKKEAEKLLGHDDIMVHQWSQFDCDARLGKTGGNKRELVKFVTEQALDWTDAEKKAVSDAWQKLNRIVTAEGYNLPVPDEVKVMKTTMMEEGGAGGYTREDFIVLQSGLDKSDPKDVELLLAHELFHVLTRRCPAFRKDMYALIGFKIADKEFEFPADLADKRITNPDVNRFDSYATFNIQGKPTDCTMAIFSSKPYNGGSFFEYLTIGLLPVKDGKVVSENGKTKVYKLSDATDFFDKVGRNTDYVINPEEVLAENFSMAIFGSNDFKSMKLIESIREYLRNNRL